MQKATIQIEGMHSINCVRSARSALAVIPGVVSADVSLIDAAGTIHYDADKVHPDQFRRAMLVMGFQAEAVIIHGQVRAEPSPTVQMAWAA